MTSVAVAETAKDRTLKRRMQRKYSKWSYAVAKTHLISLQSARLCSCHWCGVWMPISCSASEASPRTVGADSCSGPSLAARWGCVREASPQSGGADSCSRPSLATPRACIREASPQAVGKENILAEEEVNVLPQLLPRLGFVTIAEAGRLMPVCSVVHTAVQPSIVALVLENGGSIVPAEKWQRNPMQK